MLHRLRLSACGGAHEATMTFVIVRTGMVAYCVLPPGPGIYTFREPSGEPKLPPKPGIPSHGFPRKPVTAVLGGGVAPDGANRFPCVRSMSTERVFPVLNNYSMWLA